MNIEWLTQTLSPDQIRRVYKERLVRDFPADEVKPLSRIEQALARNEYICYGAMNGDMILAYGFFVVKGRDALLDYYAVTESLRDQGIGSRFLHELIGGPLADMGCVLLEVDDPDAAEGSELETRQRRLAFYLRNGLRDTGVRAKVYEVDFRILSLPVGHALSPEETRCVYSRLYHTILSPELYEKWVVIS